MPHDDPTPSLSQIRDAVRDAIERSPADETSISWLERQTRRTGTDTQRTTTRPKHRRHVLVRVIESGRLGTFRTTNGELPDLELAIRHAMAHAKGTDRIPGFPHLAADLAPVPEDLDLRDPRVVGLEASHAVDTLRHYSRDGERARLDWSEVDLVVATSKSVDRAASATGVSLSVSCGRHPGAGSASTASRTLSGIAVEATFERARRFDARGVEPGEPPTGPCSVVLSNEAAATLVDLLNRLAFTAEAYQFGGSFLRQFLGVQTFDRRITLVDDATDPAGLPFPFDLEGSAKRPVTLIEDGTPRTPALDQYHAAVLGLPPTPHASAGDDARAEHLFLAAGDHAHDDLFAMANGGLWISRFDRIECYEPRRLHVRGVARGVRRIRDGALAEPVADLVWDESLLQAFGHILGLGRTTRVVSDPSGHLGGISTPEVALGEVTGLSVYEPSGERSRQRSRRSNTSV